VPASAPHASADIDAHARIAALEAELQSVRERLSQAEARLQVVRSAPDYPQPGVAEVSALGDPDGFFRKLGDLTACGVYVYDLTLGHTVYVNPQYTALLGYSLDEVNALAGDRSLSLFHPDDKEAFFTHMVDVGRSADGEVKAIEYRFLHKGGGWVWCRSYDSVFERGEDGQMTRFMGSVVDITDVMEAKEAQANFARMAAHDLRAPTRRIRQYVEMLSEEVGDSLDVDGRYLLEAIDQQAGRMHALVDGIRRLTGMVPPTDRQFTSLDTIVDTVVDALPVRMSEMGVGVRRDPLPTLPVYPELVHALYANLVTNALRHGAVRLDLHFTAVQEGDEVVLGVSNNGPEIPVDVREEVFQPFRRTRPVGANHGPGLGLPICKRVVELHNGRIWMESGDGRVHVRFTLSRGRM